MPLLTRNSVVLPLMFIYRLCQATATLKGQKGPKGELVINKTLSAAFHFINTRRRHLTFQFSVFSFPLRVS